MDFSTELTNRAAWFDARLRDYLLPEGGFSASLAWAANYSLMAGGKRLRPILLLETFQIFSGEEVFSGGELSARAKDAERFAVALECVHTHSLVHDDLPAIDDDALRRGKPTTHAKFGEAAAVLAGDLLLNYAYEVALKSLSDGEGQGAAAKALQVLAEKTGISGMLGGQGEDVKNEKQGANVLSREELDAIYLHKTSALLEAALVIGGILGGADESQIVALEKLGANLGLAFQIRDDILDITADEKELGKPVRSDEKNEKTTYVSLLGIDGAEEEVRRLTSEAGALALQLPGDTAFLKELIRQLATRAK